MPITKSLYEALRNTFGHHKIFLPINLKKGCFTVPAKDNIDKNTTANLVQFHFHGTGISFFQFLDHENQGESLDCHGSIDAVYNIKKLAPIRRFSYKDLFEYPEVNLAKTGEHQWLQQFASSADSAKSWAQYHIHEKCMQPPIIKTTNSLLPLFGDKVNTLDMQVYTVNLNIKAINAINPGQTPADVSDCPVDALTKEAQFQFPEHFSKYFAMFGGLHIEQCLLVTHGQFIEGSGLREILETCSLATVEVGAVVDVNQIKRARYCVQVTLCPLYRKLVDEVKANGVTLDPWKWLEQKSLSSTIEAS